MEYFFLLAGNLIRLDCGFPVDLSGCPAGLIASPDGRAPDFDVRITSVSELPAPSGRLISQNPDSCFYLDGDLIRHFYSGRATDEFAACGEIPVRGNGASVIIKESRLGEFTCVSALWALFDLPYFLLTKGIITLHSSVIDTGNGAILFSGFSGCGKSTQARLWETYEAAAVLNGDKSALGIKDGILYAYALPFCGTSGICSDFTLPVRAIVMPFHAPYNTAARLSAAAALSLLAKNTFGHSAVPGCSGLISSVLLDVIERVPVIRLDCTPDERAVNAVKELLKAQ